MKPVIRQGDTLQEYGGEVLEGHYECQKKLSLGPERFSNTAGQKWWGQ
jgi:hypothetical protein